MNRRLLPATALAATLSLAAVAAPLPATTPCTWSTQGPAAPAPSRRQILDANNDPTITRIQFTGRVTTVSLSGPVVYTGPQPLTIEGNNAIIDGTNANASAIVANGGGD